jgi:2-oxo-3-hexenedioate decarboxylase
MTDPAAAATRIEHAYDTRRTLPPFSAQDRDFDLATAYAVERELVRRRRHAGHEPVGRKVGFANKAMWRVLKLDTLVWAHMYDDTVHDAPSGAHTLSASRMLSPKIEPEVVVRLKAPLAAGVTDPADVLRHVDWIALGFEIIDCVYPEWKFQPADFVAAYGLHAALVVGPHRAVDAAGIPALVDRLAAFKVRLLKNGELVEEGSGRAALRSPALCAAELASAAMRQPDPEPLAAGELISTGTLTSSTQIAAGESWRAEPNGIDLAPIALTFSRS